MHIISTTKFDHPIWKFALDNPDGWIAVETRSADFRHALFTTINSDDGKTGFKDYHVDDSWPAGLEAVGRGVVLIHGFDVEGSPAHKGLLALDAKTGDTLWRNFGWSLDAALDDRVLVFDRKMLPPRPFAVDWKTGKPISDLEKTALSPNHLTIPEKRNTWPAHLEKPFPDGFYGLVDYLVLGNVEIISLHTPDAGTFQQHLFVFRERQLIHADLLHTGIQKLQPDAFVMQRNRLVYIRHKTELVLIDL